MASSGLMPPVPGRWCWAPARTGSVAAILKNRQEKKGGDKEQPGLFHENIRGPDYYH